MTRRTRPEQDTDGGFLRRWSRRKADAESAPEEPARDEPPADEAPRSAEAEDVKTDADMPPLESIGPDSDISDFLSPGVSKALRNQALRRLFHTAAFNVTDGLDDYAENYRNFAPLGDVVTADMRHHMERERERAQKADAAAEADGQPGEGYATARDDTTGASEAPREADRDDEPVTGEAAGDAAGEDDDERIGDADARA